MNHAAILFGSIGTLVETSDLQREAFNLAFKEAGLAWHWDEATYRRLLEKPGGRSRIERFAAERGETVDAEGLHRRKTAIFDKEIEEGALDLRPGVREVIDAARNAEIPLAFVTTTSRANVEATLAATTGQLTEEMFAFIGDGSMVSASKPAPDIYLAALRALGLGAEQAIAIEDTVSCFQSARAAGLRTIAFPNENAAREGYDEAVAVVDRLEPSLFGDVLT
jgi:HAD superfamily hydrolase (TIGR01509 family)